MTAKAVLVREAGVSAIINGVLSVVFFILLFGWRGPVDVAAMGRDFLPQAFMVSLMGSLVPAFLLRRSLKLTVGARPLALRALLLAVCGCVIAGGGAWLAARATGQATMALPAALALKVAFGALLGAVITPLALLPLLRTEARS